MDINIVVGNRIKAYIKEIGMKQGFLANKIGLSPKSLNLMINGKTKINVDVLSNISNALGVDSSFFLNINSEKIG